MKRISFGLNQIIAPSMTPERFFSLAKAVGATCIEIRNDIPASPFGHVEAEQLKQLALHYGVALSSINALQRFNDWTPEREREARELVSYAHQSGTQALVLVPVNQQGWSGSSQDLIESLRALKEILRESSVMGLVEPLGFVKSSLRLKSEAIDAIDAVGGEDIFKLVHDTFHHHLADERAIFPERTGMVHISGCSERRRVQSPLKDEDRGLVDAEDLLGTALQMEMLIGGGYSGTFSFEPFSARVQNDADIEHALASSLQFLSARLQA